MKNESTKAKKFCEIMFKMNDTMTVCENMKDDDLAEALGRIVSHDRIDTMNNSIVGEVLHRWRHPLKYRFERIKKLWKRKG